MKLLLQMIMRFPRVFGFIGIVVILVICSAFPVVPAYLAQGAINIVTPFLGLAMLVIVCGIGVSVMLSGFGIQRRSRRKK